MTTLENDLYQELVLEHKRAPRNFGHLPTPRTRPRAPTRSVATRWRWN